MTTKLDTGVKLFFLVTLSSDNFRTREFEVDSNLAMFSNWGFESPLQFWTLFPHSPDNSFLGFVVEAASFSNVSVKRNQAMLYGKEGWYSQGKENYIDTIGESMQVHSTFKVSSCHRSG